MKSLQGHLLVASPKLSDPNFFRSVVLIVQHNDDGALGLVLNRPLEPTIGTVWDQVSESPCFADGHLHKGGPCDGPLMVLHTADDHSQIEVVPGVHFTTEKDAVEQLVGDPAGPALKFFLGYAGWAAGQLEGELAEHSWATTEATPEQIFLEDVEPQWDALRRVIARATAAAWVDPRFFPDDPSVN
jgi:putative transcriptional regulator